MPGKPASTLSRRELLLGLPAAAFLLSGLPGCTPAPMPAPPVRMPDGIEGLLRMVEEKGDQFELSNNENPIGPSPLALAALEGGKSFRYLHRYSSHLHLHNALKAKLAAELQVDGELVELCPGSNDILFRLVELLSSRSRPVVIAKPDYYVIAGYARRLGHAVTEIPYGPDDSFPLEAIAAAGKKAGFVYLSNPSNPLGTFLEPDRAEALLSLCGNTPVVIDEAYLHYISADAERLSAVRMLEKHRNLVVVRTFSKIHGLAGFRVGFSVCHPDTRKKLGLPRTALWSVSSPGLLAANAALSDHSHMEKARRHNQEMLALVRGFLEKHGIPHSRSRSLCLQLRLPGGDAVLEAAKASGVHFNSFVNDANALRLTMGRKEALERFLKAVEGSK